MNKTALAPLLYAGNINYFGKLKEHEQLIFDRHEHYIKQTYRSRCTIYGANGRLDLIIPVEKGKQGHRSMKDVKISYAENWQRIHWKSLESAYRTSPYFEYYEHHLVPFYENRTEYLTDFNLQLTEKLLALLDLKKQVEFSHSYEEKTTDITDLRAMAATGYTYDSPNQQYTQVFELKHGFIPHLSVFDLLFNCGPRSEEYL